MDLLLHSFTEAPRSYNVLAFELFSILNLGHSSISRTQVNRERTKWVYKHELFHRDHPEDLHLVRRRTCPGVDGRKQRIARTPARRVSVEGQNDIRSPDDDLSEWSHEEEAAAMILAEGENSQNKKRRGNDKKPTVSKRPRNITDDALGQEVDTSIIDSSENQVDDLAGPATVDPADVAEQSMIVSEVAMKLEQCAKRGGWSSRARVRAGAVTPPYESSSTGLLTYDDEYQVSKTGTGGSRSSSSSIGVITECDEKSVESEEDRYSVVVAAASKSVYTPMKTKEITVQPLMSKTSAVALTNRILERTPAHEREELAVPTVVAGFCMAHSPHGDKDIASKILHLIASCDKLSTEFQLYRSALQPSEASGPPPKHGFFTKPSDPKSHGPPTVQQTWERNAIRGDAVRDFKTFALNCIYSLTGKTSTVEIYSRFDAEADKMILNDTANLWMN